MAVVSAAADARTYSILPDVPRVGYDIRLCTFAGALESVMRYIGEPIDYDEIMAASGLAFRRLWNRDDPGNVGPLRFAPECVRRAFWTIGREHRIISYRSGRDALLGALKQSVAEGIPVIGSGIVGPPECEVVTGYSGGGRTLHGWSYFQDPAKAGYYAQADWFEKADWANDVGFIIVGERKTVPPPTPREVLVATLKWAIDLERTATRADIADHVSGLAAYDAMAAALTVDADYPADNPVVLSTRCMVMTDQAVMTEERGCAARFLRRMSTEAPEVCGRLAAAAQAFERVEEEAAPIYPWGADLGPKAQRQLADPEVRREIARHVRAACTAEDEAVGHLEVALASLLR